MSFFITSPILPPQSRELNPALIPTGGPAGSFIGNGGAGNVLATGFAGSVQIGTTFSGGPGEVAATGYPGQVVVGETIGFYGGAGNVNIAGYPGGFGETIIPPVVAATDFDMALSELALDAWERCGVSATSLTVAHFNSIRRSMNLVLSRWANRGVNLWKVSLASLSLVDGVSTYALPSNTIDMLDTYLSRSNASDVLMSPISRNTYASISNKATEGVPLQYWFNRTNPPVVTVWPVPDQTSVYTLKYYVFTEITDADPTLGLAGDMPTRFLEAYTAAVAAHLSIKWAPDRAVALQSYAKETWDEAATEDREKVTLTLAPEMGAYFH